MPVGPGRVRDEAETLTPPEQEFLIAALADFQIRSVVNIARALLLPREGEEG
jgi:hypothetical protein